MSKNKPSPQVIKPLGIESKIAFGSDPKSKYVEVVLIRAGMRDAEGRVVDEKLLQGMISQISVLEGVNKVWVREGTNGAELRAVVATNKVGQIKV